MLLASTPLTPVDSNFLNNHNSCEVYQPAFGRLINITELWLFRKFESTGVSGVDARSIDGENHHSNTASKKYLKNHNEKTTRAKAMRVGRCTNITNLLLFGKFGSTGVNGVDARSIYDEYRHWRIRAKSCVILNISKTIGPTANKLHTTRGFSTGCKLWKNQLRSAIRVDTVKDSIFNV